MRSALAVISQRHSLGHIVEGAKRPLKAPMLDVGAWPQQGSQWLDLS